MGPGTVLRPRQVGRTEDTGVATASTAYPSCFRNQLDRSARGSSVRGRNAFNVVSGAKVCGKSSVPRRLDVPSSVPSGV